MQISLPPAIREAIESSGSQRAREATDTATLSPKITHFTPNKRTRGKRFREHEARECDGERLAASVVTFRMKTAPVRRPGGGPAPSLSERRTFVRGRGDKLSPRARRPARKALIPARKSRASTSKRTRFQVESEKIAADDSAICPGVASTGSSGSSRPISGTHSSAPAMIGVKRESIAPCFVVVPAAFPRALFPVLFYTVAQGLACGFPFRRRLFKQTTNARERARVNRGKSLALPRAHFIETPARKT